LIPKKSKFKKQQKGGGGEDGKSRRGSEADGVGAGGEDVTGGSGEVEVVIFFIYHTHI
jgi:hypothetical protein